MDARIYGSFVEHMGRAVYGGIYEPSHPTADADGFRGDVLELTRELGVTVVRYPGGNFVSGVRLGGRRRPARAAAEAARPRVALHRDQRGRNGRVHALGAQGGREPMFAVNLGTRGVDAARDLVEYCNAPAGSRYADWRAENGHADPYGIRLWCLGNEMDGPWQIGHKTPVEYGRLAAEAARRCASSTLDRALRGRQLELRDADVRHLGGTVLDLAWDVADHVSLHTYYDPADYDGVDAYLACSLDLDRMIGTRGGDRGHRRRAQAQPQAASGSSVDEWNVWHQQANPHHTDVTGPFKHAPALAEDDHKVADALVVGCLLITMLRHADRVKVACLAQLVNVIPPMRTLDGGPAWRQTSFFPFMHASRFGRGSVLRLEPDGPTYDVPGEGAVPVLEAAAVLGDGALALFAVNRGDAALPVEAVLRELDGAELAEHLVLAHADLGAGNTATEPDRVAVTAGTGASVAGGVLRAELPPRSWNVLRLEGGALA